MRDLRYPGRSATLAAALTAAVLASGCGGGSDQEDENAASSDATGQASTGDQSAGADADGRDDGSGPSGSGDAGQVTGGGESRSDPATVARRQAGRAYRSYIAAINDGDGEAICRLIAPGFERQLKPAVKRGDCGRRISASIGFEDPRGFPVWERTALSAIEAVSAAAEADTARVTALIVTGFRDRDEPSVESDIAYLERVDGRWRLAKASGALYRAVGKPDVPPSVIAAPG